MSWLIPLTAIDMTEADIAAVVACLRSGWLTMGPRTAEFEAGFASYVGTRHAIAVSSGTAALHLAARAVGLGPGDEVIVPDLTFVASASAARFVGAEPVLSDIRGTHDLNLDVDDVARRLTPRTRAVVAVHFCGYPAEVEGLRELCDQHGVALIEDCAQAVGARLDDSGRRTGTVGHVGCFSLFSKKQLCTGEGGVVTTDDDDLAATVRSLRSHAMTSVTWDRHRGHADTYDVVDIGYNLRFDEPRAALASSRMRRLDEELSGRRRVVRAYRERLSGVADIKLPWSDEAVALSSHFAFPVLLRDRAARDALRSTLREAGVQTTWYPALHTLADYRHRSQSDSLARAEEIGDRHCVLPLWASMTSTEVDLVADAVVRALERG